MPIAQARWRTLSPDAAAGILAETFLVAWRKLDQVPSGPDARLWLFGVARNALADHYRGERRRTALAARLGTELAQSMPYLTRVTRQPRLPT